MSEIPRFTFAIVKEDSPHYHVTFSEEDIHRHLTPVRLLNVLQDILMDTDVLFYTASCLDCSIAEASEIEFNSNREKSE